RTLKYKAHVCTTSQSRVILDIKITTGAVHDSQSYLEQLNAIKLGLNHDIDEVIADRAYGSGHIIATLKSMGMTTTIPLFNTRSGTAQRTITPGFYYDAEKDIYRCPANYELKPGKLLKNDYMLYHSRVTHCQNCIISCQAPKKKNRAIRVIARHTHFDLFQQVTLAMQTPLFKQKLVERLARIESVMNELKNYHCLAKARFRGIHNVQIQAYMAAIAINIKRIVFLFFINVLILLKYKLPFATGRVVF
ncbi:transposase, partial [Legionella gresilensis]|uniref:transposase n=1 Tax=Legionella gresilensis TaxID=91823 RepID=UPI0013EF6AF0